MAKSSMTLSDQLRRAISNAPITRYQIAQQTGVSEAALSLFVNGHRGLSLDSLDKIATLLELQIVAPSGKLPSKSNPKPNSKD